jgi:hypothetical protein
MSPCPASVTAGLVHGPFHQALLVDDGVPGAPSRTSVLDAAMNGSLSARLGPMSGVVPLRVRAASSPVVRGVQWHTAEMRRRIGVLALVVITTATACSGSEGASTPDTGSSKSTDSGSASVEAFCVEYASLEDEQAESYVGSPQHLATIDGLLAVAPTSVTADLVIFRDYLSSGAIDSEADPESNVTENWPDDVQTAIASENVPIRARYPAHCCGSGMYDGATQSPREVAPVPESIDS